MQPRGIRPRSVDIAGPRTRLAGAAGPGAGGHGRLTEITEENVFERRRLWGYEQLDVSGDILRAYFDRLRSLTLPIGPLFNGMAGIDGTDYHLALFGDMNSEVRFQWWSKPPPQWSPLIGVANEMIEGFFKLQPLRLESSSS